MYPNVPNWNCAKGVYEVLSGVIRGRVQWGSEESITSMMSRTLHNRLLSSHRSQVYANGLYITWLDPARPYVRHSIASSLILPRGSSILGQNIPVTAIFTSLPIESVFVIYQDPSSLWLAWMMAMAIPRSRSIVWNVYRYRASDGHRVEEFA